jgi:diguanylate cyclase (GGDEF)-like protein
MEESMSALAHMVASLLKVRSIAVFLTDQEDGRLRIVGNHGLSGQFVSHHAIQADDPCVQRVLVGGEDVCTTVCEGDACGRLRLEAETGSVAATPIVAMSRTIGLIAATSDEAQCLGEEHMLILKLAARLAAACHDRCSLYEERRRNMAVEPETGLWSFEFFSNRMQEEIARSRRQSTPLSAALVDIDGFVRFRQTHGSEAADELFCQVVDVVRGAIRGIDILGRFGMDELLIALPQTDLDGAVKAAERIREAIAAADLGKPVSASIGVAELHEVEDQPGKMIERAKRALYETYLRGGNCTIAEERVA